MAGRAGAVGVVEREQPGLRLLEPAAAARAVEALGEEQVLAADHAHQRAAAALRERGLQRVHQPGAGLFARGDAVDQHEHVVAGGRGGGIEAFQLEDVLARQQAAEAALEQALEQVGARYASRRDREGHQDARILRKAEQPLRDRLRGVLGDLGAAGAAHGAPHAGEQHAQVVVDLGGGGHGRARVAGGGPLPQGDGRADPVQQVHLRLLHPLQELPGVGRQALHVAAVAFRVERVEGEAALARSGHAGDHHQAARGDGDVDPLQVVDADAASDDGFGHVSLRPVRHMAPGTKAPSYPSGVAPVRREDLRRALRHTLRVFAA